MRIHRTISFEREERQILERAALSVRIAFGDFNREDKSTWRSYPGRPLITVGHSGQDQLTPKHIQEALAAAETLVNVLKAQSHREYWQEALEVREYREHPTLGVTHSSPPPMGLVAPGTDVCGMLAETRERQLQEALDALALLYQAKQEVGPMMPTEDQESREEI